MRPKLIRSLAILLPLISCIATKNAYAQPSNDDPCNPIELTPGDNCVWQTFTTQGATASVEVPNPTCGNYNGRDVWFTFTVPCTGGFEINTNTANITDAAMAIYTGECDNLVLYDCDDDSSPNGSMPMLSSGALAPGTSVTVRLWSYGNNQVGTFRICVKTIPPPPVGQTCNSASPFCSSNQYSFPSVTGAPNSGGGGIYDCLATIPNPSYYYLQISQSGTLTMDIRQVTSSGSLIDIDFVIWGPFSSPNGLCNQLSASNVVDCSYSPSGMETATIPNAQVGDYYLLLLTNYSQQPGTLTFSQTGGTAQTNCGIVCDLAATNTGPVCPGSPFELNSTSTNGQNYVWTGDNCWTFYGQNTSTLTAPSTVGTYVYTVTTSDGLGNTCADTTRLQVVNNLAGVATTTNETCPGANNGTITVTTPGAGTYTLNPGNVVQTNPVFTGLAPGTYTVAFAAGCTGTINNLVVGTNASTLTGTATTTATTCPGASDGTVTVVPETPGAYQYVLNPGNISQASPTFTGLAAGTYTVVASAGTGCNFTVNNIVVSNGPAFTATATTSPASCAGAADGGISITPSITTGNTYTLNPGNITQPSGIFGNLPGGTYSVTITHSSGCTVTLNNIVVASGPAITSTSTTTATTCFGATNGSLTVTPSQAGTYNFSISPGTATNTTGTFNNLPAGSYTITFLNSTGCGGVANVTVADGPAVAGTSTTTATSCSGASDGILTVTPSQSGSWTFTLEGTTTTNTTGIFTGLAAGAYTVTFINSTGCGGEVAGINIVAGTALTATAATTPTACAGATDGSITVTTGTTGTYLFTLVETNATNATGIFNNLPEGIYTINYQNDLGCTGTINNIVVAEGTALTGTSAITPTSCNGATDGTITITPANTGTYTYTLVETNANNTTGVFTNLPAGTYTVTFNNSFGCTATLSNLSLIHI